LILDLWHSITKIRQTSWSWDKYGPGYWTSSAEMSMGRSRIGTGF